MKHIRILMMLAVLMFICSTGVSAKEDFHASVERLLILTNQDKIVETMFRQMKQLQIQQLQQMNLTKEQITVTRKYFDKIYAVMNEEMGWDKMKEDFINLYMSVYTEEEIQGLIDFYQSPLGKKLIAKTPVLMEQSAVISQKYMNRIMPQLQAISAEMVKELVNTPVNQTGK